MYKYLLCWRYLRTRYIALASIVSVMLGVATMIVVNSVMAGFSTTMRERLHGTLSDIIIESYQSLDGFQNSEEVMAAVAEATGDDVEAMAPAMQIFGLAMIPVGSDHSVREVQIIGVRPEDRARVSDFAQHLYHQPRDGREVRAEPSFKVTEELRRRSPAGQVLEGMSEDDALFNIFENHALAEVPEHGMIIGHAMATHYRPDTGDEFYFAPEGTKVILTFPSAGTTPKATQDNFTVVSYFKSGMSEHDSMQVYVPLERLQYLRGQGDGKGNGAVNQIQVKARDGVDLDQFAQTIFISLEKKWPRRFLVSTWEQKQGPLLAAVEIEQNILNILLFFIIAVAGFGILGIFSMIVVEKTRDIGILKALGASTSGVRGIFLAYGLALGAVGSGVGMIGGLLFVRHINEIERGLSVLTGRKVFDDAIYYFPEIPTLVEPLTVAWIVVGAMFIAVAASVWPAQRAAKMHPVQALRYE